MAEHKPYCCFIQEQTTILGLFEPSPEQIAQIACKNPAEWRIIENGASVDDYTEACTAHVGYLLTDAKSFTVIPIDADDVVMVYPEKMVEQHPELNLGNR